MAPNSNSNRSHTEPQEAENPLIPVGSKGLRIYAIKLIARKGFEPLLSDPESLVLPLHHQAEWFAESSKTAPLGRSEEPRVGSILATRDLPIPIGYIF